MKVLNGLRSNAEESQEDTLYYQKQVYHKHLKYRTFSLWRKVLAFLKEENKIVDTQYAKIIKRFRTIKLGRKALEALTDYTYTTKIERQKNSFKNNMRSKVGKWLKDFDKKEKTIEPTGLAGIDDNPNVVLQTKLPADIFTANMSTSTDPRDDKSIDA